MNKINVISASDNFYAQHLGVMLISLLNTSNNPEKFNIFIIDGGISRNNKIKITNVLKKFRLKPNFIRINKDDFTDLKISEHISYATYYRIIIPNILKKTRKILYLDCDLIIKKDLRELWETNLGNFYLAAVEDPTFTRYDQLRIPKESNYFNAGVMLIDMQKWRQNSIPQKVLSFIRENESFVKFWDQDGLNHVLFNKWKKIAPKYNQQRSFFLINYSKTSFTKKQFVMSKKDPAIIHFTTGIKPWQYIDCHPYKSEYYKYLEISPWCGYEPSGMSIVNIVKRFVWSNIWKYIYLPKK